MGCLKDALFELHEGVAWGLLDSSFEKQQRQQVWRGGGRSIAYVLQGVWGGCQARPACSLKSSALPSRPSLQLVNAAANELASDKLLMVELAREHGVLEGYTTQLKVRVG